MGQIFQLLEKDILVLDIFMIQQKGRLMYTMIILIQEIIKLVHMYQLHINQISFFILMMGCV